jgi:hypothetical protein
MEDRLVQNFVDRGDYTSVEWCHCSIKVFWFGYNNQGEGTSFSSQVRMLPGTEHFFRWNGATSKKVVWFGYNYLEERLHGCLSVPPPSTLSGPGTMPPRTLTWKFKFVTEVTKI